MTQDEKKRRAAEEAIEHIEAGAVIGVGSGTTVNLLIEILARAKHRIEGAVPSSQATEARLKERRIPVVDLNHTGGLPLYIDGADEATKHLQLIKGGGGALTREKIIAAASRRFLCIVDDSKLVDVLGRYPLPIEVLPMARSYVARELVKLGGQPQWRSGYITDNGNVILDVR
ncbi:MAG: ribose-5-phosphate isomerase RpiA, partial [Gammaproteobacteria bacterium]|nr:ribose-5-phosphate isomerase RpiA [Gammaproteobacteria bacterium]